MNDDRWTTGDAELTNALRALYAAPADESYWTALESRILAHVARRDESSVWWAELADMARPGLVAAAALIFAASLALMHSRQIEVRIAYENMSAPTPSSVEASTRGTSVGEGDATINLLLSR